MVHKQWEEPCYGSLRIATAGYLQHSKVGAVLCILVLGSLDGQRTALCINRSTHLGCAVCLVDESETYGLTLGQVVLLDVHHKVFLACTNTELSAILLNGLQFEVVTPLHIGKPKWVGNHVNLELGLQTTLHVLCIHSDGGLTHGEFGALLATNHTCGGVNREGLKTCGHIHQREGNLTALQLLDGVSNRNTRDNLGDVVIGQRCDGRNEGGYVEGEHIVEVLATVGIGGGYAHHILLAILHLVGLGEAYNTGGIVHGNTDGVGGRHTFEGVDKVVIGALQRGLGRLACIAHLNQHSRGVVVQSHRSRSNRKPQCIAENTILRFGTHDVGVEFEIEGVDRRLNGLVLLHDGEHTRGGVYLKPLLAVVGKVAILVDVGEFKLLDLHVAVAIGLDLGGGQRVLRRGLHDCAPLNPQVGRLHEDTIGHRFEHIDGDSLRILIPHTLRHTSNANDILACGQLLGVLQRKRTTLGIQHKALRLVGEAIEFDTKQLKARRLCAVIGGIDTNVGAGADFVDARVVERKRCVHRNVLLRARGQHSTTENEHCHQWQHSSNQ